MRSRTTEHRPSVRPPPVSSNTIDHHEPPPRRLARLRENILCCLVILAVLVIAANHLSSAQNSGWEHAAAFTRTFERDPDGLALYRAELGDISVTVRIDGSPWRVCREDQATGRRSPCWRAAYRLVGTDGTAAGSLDPSGRPLRLGPGDRQRERESDDAARPDPGVASGAALFPSNAPPLDQVPAPVRAVAAGLSSSIEPIWIEVREPAAAPRDSSTPP